MQEEADDELPLFATRLPTGGLTPGLQAIAALIDEDDDDKCSRPSRVIGGKRKASSMGETQVMLTLSNCMERPAVRIRPNTPAAVDAGACATCVGAVADSEGARVATPKCWSLCNGQEHSRVPTQADVNMSRT